MLSYSIFFSLWICSYITPQKWQCWVPAWKRNVFVQSWKYHCLLSLYALLFYHNILEYHHGLLCQSVPHRVKKKSRVFSLKNNPELLRVNVQEAKVTKRLVAVMVGFACCSLPIAIIDNIDIAHGEPTLPRLAYLTYGFLLYLSSTINPFIYCATDKRFRREYKAVFWKSFGFKCRANNENNDA